MGQCAANSCDGNQHQYRRCCYRGRLISNCLSSSWGPAHPTWIDSQNLNARTWLETHVCVCVACFFVSFSCYFSIGVPKVVLHTCLYLTRCSVDWPQRVLIEKLMNREIRVILLLVDREHCLSAMRVCSVILSQLLYYMVSVSFKNAVITLCIMTVLNISPLQIS